MYRLSFLTGTPLKVLSINTYRVSFFELSNWCPPKVLSTVQYRGQYSIRLLTQTQIRYPGLRGYHIKINTGLLAQKHVFIPSPNVQVPMMITSKLITFWGAPVLILKLFSILVNFKEAPVLILKLCPCLLISGEHQLKKDTLQKIPSKKFQVSEFTYRLALLLK